MESNVKNPFFYGGTASGENFCNRVVELRDIKSIVDNSSNVFIFGERRLGKTSLLQKLTSILPDDDYIHIYIDLWACNTEEDAVKVCAISFTSTLEKSSFRLLKKAKELFSSLSPSITLDSDGNPSLSFSSFSYTKDDPVLEQVLSLPQKIAEKYPEKQIVIIFDEFQQIRSFESDKFERVLRSTIQNHDMVSYLFCGSKKHLINDMFMSRKSPLFRSAAHYPIGVIALNHWVKFITHQFLITGKNISTEIISEIFELTSGHPFYTQMLSGVLWEISDSTDETDSNKLNDAVEIMLNREQYAYMTLWETLTLNVRKMLIAIAKESKLKTPYASDIIKKYGVKSTSTAQKAIQKLKSEEIIDTDNDGVYYISDRFLSLWISKKMQNSFY